MPSYETQYNCENSSQGYSLDQYEASTDSNSSSPRTQYSNSSLKARDSYPTPSTDSSNEPDESTSFNYPFSALNACDPYKCKKIFKQI